MTKLRQFLLLNYDQMQPQISILHNKNIMRNTSQIQESIVIDQIIQSSDMLAEMMKKMDARMSVIEKGLSASGVEKDPRFSMVHYPMTLGKDSTKEQVTVWCGLMAKEVFEHAFSLFVKGDLDEDEAKCLASSSFLHNLLGLAQSGIDLSKSINEIDTKLRKKILPYLKGKFPQSKSKEVNLKLNEAVKEINDMENNANDLMFKSGIKFQFSEKKQYDEPIMKFLNYIIDAPNSEVQKKLQQVQQENQKKQKKQTHEKKRSFLRNKFQEEKIQENPQKNSDNLGQDKKNKKQIYEYFYQQFEKIFEKTYSKDEITAMENKNTTKKSHFNDQIKQKKDEEYKEKVKEYTKFFINRKISPNTPKFSDEQIKEGNLRLKNSALMRVVTKWCEELRKNFTDSHNTAHKHGQFRMVDGSQRYLPHDEARLLQFLLENKNKEIQIWLKKVQEHNLSTQQEFSKKKITDPDLEMLSEEESLVGMFAAINHRNYQFYLINYLKELIHHSLSVMSDFEILRYSSFWGKISRQNIVQAIKDGEMRKKQSKDSFKNIVINMMSFKIGDLLRCKYSSKQKEVNALYHYFHQESIEHPQKLKIVKIKNRLEKGTKDILLNLLLQEKILVEVQLAIDAGKNRFIECSDTFNHYIYEVERAQFGPISELCSIWMNKDPRANFFRQCFQEKYRPNFPLHYFSAKEQNNQQKTVFPFLCEQEKCNRYGINPLSVQNANKYCIHCILNQYEDYTKIKEINAEFKKLPNVGQEKKVKRIKYEKIGFQFPNSGMVMNIKQKQKRHQFFRSFQRGKQKFLMILKQEKFFKIGEITKKYQQQLFLQDNLVFDHPLFQEKTNQIQEKDVIKRYFIPDFIQKMKNEQKRSIKIINEGLSDEQLEGEVFDFVQSVNLSENQLRNLNVVAKKFPKIEKLILTSNDFNQISIQSSLENLRQFHLDKTKIKDIEQINLRNIKGIEILTLCHNVISKLPQQIGELSHIKHLNLGWNKVMELPTSFESLSNLQTLDLQENQLSKLRTSFGSLSNLQKLFLDSNKLWELPTSFGSLSNLQTLYLSKNQLSELPTSFGSLSNLQTLDLQENQLSELPTSFGSLSNLQTLYLSKNQLSELPTSFGSLSNLQKLFLDSNKLRELPTSFGSLSNLQTLYLSKNQLSELPTSFGSLSNLQTLYLQGSQLSELPTSFGSLSNLQKLFLDSNKLWELPTSFGSLSNLEKLQLRVNQLSELPTSFGSLSNLQKLFLDSNKLRELPTSFGSLSNLEKLQLRVNQLSELPTSFGSLSNLQTLYLQGSQLSELPTSFGSLSNLEKLQLRVNQLSELPTSFGSLSNLQTLYLQGSQLSELPTSFGSLSNLEKLQLRVNQLSELPTSFGSLSNLQKLFLDYNKLRELPTSFGSLSNLQTLYLQGSQLSELPTSFGSLSNLEKLQLRVNQLSELPTSFGSLSNLQTLYLQGSQLSELPTSFGSLSNLQKLFLDYNKLRELPTSFGSLSNLQTLYLSKNQLSELPTSFGSLSNLEKLQLRVNQLSELPTSFGSLSNLQTLYLQENQLSKLPTSFGSLSNLQELQLRVNQLCELPTSFGSLRNLQTLHLQENQLSELPTSFGSLSNLQTLYLQENQLSKLPTSFGSLSNLQELQLRVNQLCELPTSFGSLRNLQTLHLQENQLSELPTSFGSLSNLQTLDLQENQLSELPTSFGSLSNLQTLDLQENQLSELPTSFGSLSNLQELYLSQNQLSELPQSFGELNSLRQLKLKRKEIQKMNEKSQKIIQQLQVRGVNVHDRWWG